ncbi:MAG: hypothetical protein HOK97_24070 [Deltaproteobacteria bacterium]|nr:hypothetical protein [Deltaproteobacteria bacterium]MBT6492869.1 hypothetical protein [Deltaproteobacteria bacterium]
MLPKLSYLAAFTYIPYAALFFWAAWERSWTFMGALQLFSMALMLWGCGVATDEAWKRGGSWRFVGVSVGSLPWVSFGWLIAFHNTPMGPGVVTMLLTGTTMAWSYVGAGLPTGVIVSICGMLILAAGIFRMVLRFPFGIALGCGALCFHLASLWLVLVAYEDLPKGATVAEIESQVGVTQIDLGGQWDTARDLLIDSNEGFALAAFMSSNRGSNKERTPGLVRISLSGAETTFSLKTRMGDTIVLDETTGLIWFSDFLDGHVRALKANTLAPTGQSFEVKPWPDGVAQLDDGRLVVRVETPRRDDSELHLIETVTGEQTLLDVEPHRWGTLNAAMEVARSRNEIFLLQTGNDKTTLSAVSPSGVRVQKLFGGIIWEAAWDTQSELIWLGSMTENCIFKVQPQTLESQCFEIPNGVREIMPLGDSWLALADYLRARVYVFDGEKIQRTIEVGRKPEAMALGPKSGDLYVLSDAGLTRISKPRTPAEP